MTFISSCPGRDCGESPSLRTIKSVHTPTSISISLIPLSLKKISLETLNSLCSMFPPEQSDHFLIHYYTHNEDSFQQDLIQPGQASLEGSNLTNNMGKSQQHKILATEEKNEGSRSNVDDYKKKMMRKEIERKRRQDMATLNASLRSLLPLESIKGRGGVLQGKRSASDHINEAVNYINHLKQSIQDLSVKRDKLKNLTNFEAGLDSGNATSNNCLTDCVVVTPYSGGVEIVINSVLKDHEDLLLSRVLHVLLEEGLDVTRCLSTQGDDGFFRNIIQSEVEDLTCVDLHGLQQKLNDVVISPRYLSDSSI